MVVNPYDFGPSGAAPQGRPSTPWRVYVEDALIVLAIPVLWLTVLRMSGPLVIGIQVITLVVMLVVFFARGRRLLVARREAEEEARRL